jgi:alpha-tubulin suppressor-like RCC1 family protein
MWSWGSNTYGQLGQGDTSNRSSPVQVGALTTWAQIAAGRAFCAAIKTDGTMWAWGRNAYGSLGVSDPGAAARSSPVQIGALTTWSKISAGRSTCFAIKVDKTLWSWGQNQFGQIGDNTTTYRSRPVQVGALTDWAQITVHSTALAVKTNGTLWSWGANASGVQGRNSTVTSSSPVQVGALSNWAQVSIGNNNGAVLALKTDGTLWSWGNNFYGQLGLGDRVDRSSPVQIGAGTDWEYISAGGFACVATKTDGTVWTWGINGGRLGTNNNIDRSSPVQVGANTYWNGVATFNSGTFFLAAL